MDDLRVGELVQVTDPAGIQGTSKFVGWTEKHRSLTKFHRLTTESGNILTMTGSHGLFIWKAGSVMATFAKDLSVGDFLVVSQSSNSSQAERLRSISIVNEFGALGPLTESGTIMVNNVSTSCYASYTHHLAHFALLPARWWPQIFLDDEESQTREGTRSYITNIKWLGRLLSPSGFRTDNQITDSSLFTNTLAPLASAFVIGLSVVVFYKKATL
jgi:hedgehog protein